MKELNGVVLKQWAISKVEVLKSAFYSALAVIALSVEKIVEKIIMSGGVEMPTGTQLKTLGGLFVSTFILFIIRYYIKPTTTVIQGEVKHQEKVVVNTKPETVPE